ncbi:MAG: hypothetical protein SNJ63_10735, partial [Sphingomonadaceae bacterium]
FPAASPAGGGPDWLWLAIGLLAGALVGFLVARLLGTRQASPGSSASAPQPAPRVPASLQPDAAVRRMWQEQAQPDLTRMEERILHRLRDLEERMAHLREEVPAGPASAVADRTQPWPGLAAADRAAPMRSEEADERQERLVRHFRKLVSEEAGVGEFRAWQEAEGGRPVTVDADGFLCQGEAPGMLYAIDLVDHRAALFPGASIVQNFIGRYNQRMIIGPAIGDAFDFEESGGGRLDLRAPAIAEQTADGRWKLLERGLIAGLAG